MVIFVDYLIKPCPISPSILGEILRIIPTSILPILIASLMWPLDRSKRPREPKKPWKFSNKKLCITLSA
jgi:hypothetical protein